MYAFIYELAWHPQCLSSSVAGHFGQLNFLLIISEVTSMIKWCCDVYKSINTLEMYNKLHVHVECLNCKHCVTLLIKYNIVGACTIIP